MNPSLYKSLNYSALHHLSTSTVTLAGDSHTVEYTTVKGSDWGLKFYGNPSASRPVWTGW